MFTPGGKRKPNGVAFVALVGVYWPPGVELLVVLGTALTVVVTVVLEVMAEPTGEVAFELTEAKPPLVVLAIDRVEVKLVV